MSPLDIRFALRRSRYRFTVVVVLLVLGGAVAVHHGMPQMHSMPAGAVCLAVLGAVVLLGAAISAVRQGRLGLPRPLPRRALSSLIPAPPLAIAARAGPLYLRFGVLRR